MRHRSNHASLIFGLLSLLICSVGFAAKDRSFDVQAGMSYSEVAEIMGKPKDKQFLGSKEAWQYCKTGFMRDKYTVIYFFENQVLAVSKYTGGVDGLCTSGFRSIDWNKFPSDRAEPKATVVSSSSGSCFFVDAFGSAVTSNHVVDGHSKIEIIMPDGSKSSARILKSSNSLDTAFLGSGLTTPNFLTFANASTLVLGQQVFTIGYPATNILGDAPKYSEGTISALSGLNNDDSWIQMSTPIQPGNSGGPLVDIEGHVIGIVAATAAVENFFSKTGSLPQNVNWAIKAEYARPLIPGASSAGGFSDRQAAIAHTEKSICRVIAY